MNQYYNQLMTETLASIGHFLVIKQSGTQPISFLEDLTVIGSNDNIINKND